MSTETIQLTTEQQAAVDAAIEAIGTHRTLFKIGGYAGTGKTTVAKYIVDQMTAVMCCAFTGKAAYRLRQKGLHNTATIHRTIYDYDAAREEFVLKFELDGRSFLIDEGSMISTDLWNDIISFGLPVIMLGDPGQLEPVGSDPRLMHTPDIILTQIHRQAAESGIIQFATNIRKRIHVPGMEYKDVTIARQASPNDDDLLWSDIVLCGFNRTRIATNKRIRQLYGYAGLLNPGEKVIILKNSLDLGVFNGQIVTVEKVLDETASVINTICLTDDGERLHLPFLKSQFNNPVAEKMLFQGIALADYGYAITVHKSQGSEWDRVTVIDQHCDAWNPVRWRYTAVTRAAKELRFFVR